MLIPSDMEAVHPSTSTNGITFVLQVSKRYADSLEASFRSGIPYISGVTILLERHLRMEDPICASLGNWQHLVVMAQTHCAENIILQGPVDRLKEVCMRVSRTLWSQHHIIAADQPLASSYHALQLLPISYRTTHHLLKIVDHLVRNVWLPRRTSSKPMQVSVPLVGPNSPLASGVRRGVFSNVAEQSASVISLEQGPKEPTYSRVSDNRASHPKFLIRNLCRHFHCE